MYGFVVGLGLIILLGLAVAAGMIIAGERLHRERQRLDARRWELYFWEQEIVNTAELRGCRSCQLLRHRADLQRPPTEPEAA
jgi:hypothetical protein